MKKSFQTLFFVFLSFLILEAGTRALLSIKPVERLINKNTCDVLSRWQWVKRHRLGKLIKIDDIFNNYASTKGWGLIPNISKMPCFKNKIINTNSKGLRGAEEHAYAKDKGKLRILLLGDSFTFGSEVSDNETYPFYLQQLLPNAEVINMGVNGYGHDQMLIYLKEEGIKYKPDIIILGFLSLDSDRNMLKFYSYAKPKFKLVNNELELCNSPVPPPEIILKREPWRSKFVDLLDILMSDISMKDGSYVKKREAITDAILKEIVNTAKGIASVPIFVYLDDLRSKDSSPVMTKEERIFLGKCKGIPVRCVFLRQKVLSAREAGLKIKENGHFGPETNQLIALGIKEYLLKNDLLEKK